MKTDIDSIKQKEILTRKETAKLLGINLSTLWAYTKAGKLTSYGLGNKIFYKYSEILEKSLIKLN
ncbi:MAG: putative site-specific integrase-resolvase [Psychromonas sp.]|jgi:predicted site-specific integrase-resolvase